MIKAVIFDFDDTLCLTEEACYRLESEVIKEMGGKPADREVYRKTWGEPFKAAIAIRYPGVDVKQFMDQLNQKMAKYVEIGKFDNVPEQNLQVLDQLSEEGKTLILLTSRAENGVKHLIDPTHHIGSRMSAIYHVDNNPFHKPDPQTFAVLEKYHGLKPKECVYVGDSMVDAAAAKNAGLYFIASLESGLRNRDDFRDYPVDIFINKFSDVLPAVHKIEELTQV